MSVRRQIYDAVVDALESSTGIKYVTEKLEPWWDWRHSKFPGVAVIDADETRKRFSYVQPTAGDIEGRVAFELHAYDYDRNNDLDTKRNTLIQNIRKALLNDTTLNALVLSIVPGDWRTVDDGQIDNYCYLTHRFTAWYLYNHLSP
jgi:hypothetical protein